MVGSKTAACDPVVIGLMVGVSMWFWVRNICPWGSWQRVVLGMCFQYLADAGIVI